MSVVEYSREEVLDQLLELGAKDIAWVLGKAAAHLAGGKRGSRKARDPSAPKKEATWFAKAFARVSAVLKKAMTADKEAGVHKSLSGIAMRVTGMLKDDGLYTKDTEATEEEIFAAYESFKTAPPAIKGSGKKSTGSKGSKSSKGSRSSASSGRSEASESDAESDAEEKPKKGKRTMSEETKAKIKATKAANKAKKEAEKAAAEAHVEAEKAAAASTEDSESEAEAEAEKAVATVAVAPEAEEESAEAKEVSLTIAKSKGGNGKKTTFWAYPIPSSVASKHKVDAESTYLVDQDGDVFCGIYDPEAKKLLSKGVKNPFEGSDEE